ncbi:ABC transporter substrate-binding protein [Chelativorans salis]|uniref:ABC transporter substrate-binding protein n=1 Tax=Chelativorans salis TaxID=2978478 RepID=A0ABT2LI32_9HYPH|nr:ABC transporter substrate-binding protein [Chelativorans sp. EGI FJ00035]MCT7374230.1 ABC transporter substrate-binding protein [Chelativorans sp. EGI FJ00035]
MTCCNDTKLDVIWPKPDPKPNRRTLLKAAGSLAGAAAVTRPHIAKAQQKVTLAFCSQLLCVTPYEVTRFHGFFENEGLEVELVYTRGGNAAMQALVGGAVDYAATSFDVAVQAFANGGGIRRFATTGRLPLFALAVAPGEVDAITSLADLEGRTVGVSALGNADHTLMLFLLAQAGVDSSTINFAVLGPNLYEGLRRGQVAAGMVQEPALSLLVEEGGRVLFNAMDIDDAQEHLGGPYEFMGVAYRADEREDRLEQMRAVARALEAGLRYQSEAPIERLRESLPSELLVGGDGERFDEIVSRYKDSLYPTQVAIDRAACQRVVDAQRMAGILEQDIDLDQLLDQEVVPA